MEERKLTRDVLLAAKINYDDDKLIIPIMDEHNKVLFNKYRKAPWRTDNGPKYTYDSGSKSALFGLNSLNLNSEYVYIVEGEIDALTMHVLGHPCVSSTGGAGTWNTDWNKHLEGRTVYICYDADSAGARGAIKTALKLGRPSTICALDPAFGSDINEQWSRNSGLAYEPVPIAHEQESDIPFIMTGLRELRRKSFSQDGTKLFEQYDVILEHLNEVRPQKAVKRKKPSLISGSMEEQKKRALEYPIKNIIKVSPQGVAICPFHKEKTGSLHVYKDNHAYCFGSCRKRYDSIDIYMDKMGCDFKKAVNDLQ